MAVRRLTPAPSGDPLADLRGLLLGMSPDALEAFCAGLDPADLDVVEHVLDGRRARRWVPRPHQVPPPADDLSWDVWLLLAGRGAGKTDACAALMNEHAEGPPCLPGLPGGHRMAIIAPTLGDASDAAVNGPSGLRAHNPSIAERTRKGGTFVTWPNGAEAKLFGAYTRQDVERLRAGGNRCFVWTEELAAWRYLRACWNHMMFGLRLGPHPRVIASTTPKNRPHLRSILGRKATRVSTATTYDNPHLSDTVKARYEEAYGGTRLGRQELDGELLGDVEGALWTDEMIEASGRVDEAPRDLRRIVVGVDPSWGTTGDECGIVVAGIGWDNLVYVLADYSMRGGPAAWAERAAEAYHTFRADRVVAEGNFQGEQVNLAMRHVEHPDGPPMFNLVNASRGKALRAEPVVMLYEQRKVRHVGRMATLEYQMTHWVPKAPRGEVDDKDDDPQVSAGPSRSEHESDDDTPREGSDYSPDRIDALVFAITEIALGDSGPATVHRPGVRSPIRSSTVRRPTR